MRLCLGAGLVLWMSGVGVAQDASRLAKLAELYSIDLARGDWQHESSPVCPAFTHHSFVYYHRTPQPGVRTSFLAVYSSAPGSPVRLVPWAGELLPGENTKHTVSPVGPATVAQFNAVWREELDATGAAGTFTALTWTGLAECYARFTGEQPVLAPDPPGLDVPPAIDVRQPAQGALVTVTGEGGQTQSLAILFDGSGMLQSARIAAGPRTETLHPGDGVRVKVMGPAE